MSWLNAQEPPAPAPPDAINEGPLHGKWKAPPRNMLKCNVGASWNNSTNLSGASWIIRDDQGRATSHSRRSYSGVLSSSYADLLAIFWAIDSIKHLRLERVILEIATPVAYERITSLAGDPSRILEDIHSLIQRIGNIHITLVPTSLNKVASEVALSVTRDQRVQSYVAHGGPMWLNSLIQSEASASVSSLY